MTQLLLPIIYLAFISLGLPDSLLGSAWPTMYPQLGVPFSYAGILSMIISLGTIVSSLNSDRLTRALGAGKVTAISVGMTAAALFGFSISTQFWMLCLWAVPYGLGAGSVDAALNNYVALHYESRHMSWLHCMWGIGTMVSPMVMGRVLAGGGPWTSGYRYIALFQILPAIDDIHLLVIPAQMLGYIGGIRALADIIDAVILAVHKQIDRFVIQVQHIRHGLARERA